MNNLGHFLIAFPAGLALGTFYFVNLWMTVRQLPTTAWPVRLTIGSLLTRMVITLLGFYLVMNGHWERALICLAGFLVARTILMRIWHPKNPNLNLDKGWNYGD